MSVEHDTIIITGGNSGIGRATAHRLLLDWPDARCVLGDLGTGNAALLVDRFGTGRVLAVTCDVRDPTDGAALVEAATEWGDTITGLVNCAGNQQNVPSVDLTPADWRRILDVHLDGTFYTTQAFARHLIEQSSPGVIVNFSSIARQFGWVHRLPYAVAKAGIDALTRTLAVEWAEYDIRMNAIAPGYIETPMVQAALDDGRLDPRMRQQHAMRRFGTPDEIAKVVKFLLSNESSFMTGSVVLVDGGFSAVKLPYD